MDYVQKVQIISTVIQSLAIVIGGIWAYFRFRKKREDRAKAVLGLDVEHFGLDENKILVRVKVKVNNVGNVLLKPAKSTITIDKIIPSDSGEYEKIIMERPSIGDSDDTLLWPTIAQREQALSKDRFEIEPNENDEIWSDFIINHGIKLFQVYARIDCEKAEDGYWGTVKLVAL